MNSTKTLKMGFTDGSTGKESTCSAGDLGSIPGLGRSPGEWNDFKNDPHPKKKNLKKNKRLAIIIIHKHCRVGMNVSPTLKTKKLGPRMIHSSQVSNPLKE